MPQQPAEGAPSTPPQDDLHDDLRHTRHDNLPDEPGVTDGSAGTESSGGGLSFVMWLIVAMSAGLLISTVLDYALTSQELERQVIGDLTLTTQTQAQTLDQGAGRPQYDAAIERALQSIASGDGAMSAAVLDGAGRELLTAYSGAASGSTAATPAGTTSPTGATSSAGTTSPTGATSSAGTTTPGGATSAAGSTGVQLPADLATVAAVAADGVARTTMARSTLTTYVRLDGTAPRVLMVIRSSAVVNARLTSLKRRTLPIFLLGIPLGVAAFYLTGGRRLARRYRHALDRSGLDSLTGLGNRAGFREEIVRSSCDALRTGTTFALALLDIDHFKRANDDHGHRYGDEVLTDVGRLLRALPESHRAFRIGGDEFAVVLLGCDAAAAADMIELVRGRFARSRHSETLSCGLAPFDLAAPDADDLIDRADTALYAAKGNGRDRVAIFGALDGSGALTQRRAGLVALLETGAVSVVFQPIWDLDSDHVLAYEALARPNPVSGFDNPTDLFAVAERTGLTLRLDMLCIATALASAASLPPDARLFINLCPYTLADPDFAPEDLARMIHDAGLPEGRVTVEITENGRVDWAALRHRLERLRSLGIAMALDDVGSGDTGLQVMRVVDADYLKVDRAIIEEAMDSLPARSVLAAILAYAAGTNSYVIAEGIETSSMLELVRAQTIDPLKAQVRGAQGYLLGRPAAGFLPSDTSASALQSPRQA